MKNLFVILFAFVLPIGAISAELKLLESPVKYSTAAGGVFKDGKYEMLKTSELYQSSITGGVMNRKVAFNYYKATMQVGKKITEAKVFFPMPLQDKFTTFTRILHHDWSDEKEIKIKLVLWTLLEKAHSLDKNIWQIQYIRVTEADGTQKRFNSIKEFISYYEEQIPLS